LQSFSFDFLYASRKQQEKTFTFTSIKRMYMHSFLVITCKEVACIKYCVFFVENALKRMSSLECKGSFGPAVTLLEQQQQNKQKDVIDFNPHTCDFLFPGIHIDEKDSQNISVVAQQPIPAFQLVMSCQPLTSVTVYSSPPSGETIESWPSLTYSWAVMLHKYLETASVADKTVMRDHLLRLWPRNSSQKEKMTSEDTFHKLDLNCSGCIMKDGSHQRFLHKSLSYIEHSCQPNCIVIEATNEADGNRCGNTSYLITIRPVAAGEHLSRSYCAEAMSLEDRRKMLKEIYDFDCNCTACRDKIDLVPDSLNVLKTHLQSMCGHCNQVLKSVHSTCGDCTLVRFCSAGCQELGRQSHSNVVCQLVSSVS
jgi:hypothetical protein